jgi:hypothetical protein
VIRYWDGRKRRLRDKCQEELPVRFNITVVDDGAGSTQKATPEETIAAVAELIGATLKLLCKDPEEGVSVMVLCSYLALMHCQDPLEAFTNGYIFELLEFFMFIGQTAFGINHTSRFGGAYPLPAVAFVCTLVSARSFCE